MARRLSGWKRELLQAHGLIGGLFARSEVRERSLAYLQGLLSGCERKNGWQLAEWMGESAPYAVQHLLDRACWDADQARDLVRSYAISELGSEDAVLIVDETGFLKKGRQSVGVKRQYSGTAGRIENSQVGVFLCYASDHGAALVDRSLYIPREWAEDLDRRRVAKIPESVEFATKPELARQMLQRALDAGTPCGWVTADEVYGSDTRLRRWLETRQQAFVLVVACDQRLWRPLGDTGFEQQRVDRIAQQLPLEAWKRISVGCGAKGERMYDWALLQLNHQDGWEKALLVRRSIDDPTEYAYYLTYAPQRKSTLKTLARVAGRRWEIEIAFQAAKGECGLDHYEVRHWQGWHRHITLAMLAHAVLAVLRSRGEKNSPWARPAQRTGTASPAGATSMARVARS
jgi:SRSO17 transposase